MSKNAAIFFISVLSVFACQKSEPQKVRIVLDAAVEDAIRPHSERTAQQIAERLASIHQDGIRVTPDSSDPGKILLAPIVPDTEAAIGELLRDLSEWSSSRQENSLIVSLKSEARRAIEETAFLQTQKVIRSRIESLGIRRYSVGVIASRKNSIFVEIPNDSNLVALPRLLIQRAEMAFKPVAAGPSADQETLLREYGGQIPAGMEILEKYDQRGMLYLVQKAAVISGDDVESARVSKDEWDNPAVFFKLKKAAAARFESFTRNSIGKILAIVLNGRIRSAPTINASIPDGEGIIQGRFTAEETEDLVLILRSGDLPCALKVISRSQPS